MVIMANIVEQFIQKRFSDRVKSRRFHYGIVRNSWFSKYAREKGYVQNSLCKKIFGELVMRDVASWGMRHI